MKKILIITILFISNIAMAQKSEINELIEAANDGSKNSNYNLGVRYSNGDGVKKNLTLANKHYFIAAEMNFAPAQNNLGWSYREGLGVPINPLQAIYWFRLSALQGNALALQNLAEMYLAGEGVTRQPAVAETFYTLCATQVVANEESTVKESGINNAIHECRRELGKLIALRSKDKQSGLKLAAFWLNVSLVQNDDVKKDTEIGLRTRKSTQETLTLLDMVDKKLTPESKKWVTDNLKNWNDIREVVQDRTAFPLTTLECTPDKMVL